MPSWENNEKKKCVCIRPYGGVILWFNTISDVLYVPFGFKDLIYVNLSIFNKILPGHDAYGFTFV